MSRHTSGPWEVDWGTGAIETPTGGAIAYVAQHGNVNTITRTGETFSSADARLISTAPEMYKLLKSMVDNPASCYVCNAGPAPCVDCDCGQCERTRAAIAVIAKAEGRS